MKIEDLEVLPPMKLVSYNVSALSTSIPVDEGVGAGLHLFSML